MFVITNRFYDVISETNKWCSSILLNQFLLKVIFGTHFIPSLNPSQYGSD